MCIGLSASSTLTLVATLTGADLNLLMPGGFICVWILTLGFRTWLDKHLLKACKKRPDFAFKSNCFIRIIKKQRQYLKIEASMAVTKLTLTKNGSLVDRALQLRRNAIKVMAHQSTSPLVVGV